MLEINSLSKHFGKIIAVDDLNMTIEEGSIIGLIGRNGSGKTTTFRMILKLLVPNTGSITWKEKPITYADFDMIGYLPEERSLYPKETVENQILYFAELRNQNRKEIKGKIDEWMAAFQVKGKKTDLIKSLSKGNQQKIQLITTLIHEPELIILDEPFSGLDPVNADLLKASIIAAKKRGACIIFSSHDMNNVEDLCDHLLMLDNGKTVLNGKVNEIRESFGRTKLFIETSILDEELLEIDGVESVELTNDGIKKLILTDASVGQSVFNVVTRNGYIQNFSQQPPTLEEIFKMKAGKDYA